MPTDSQPLTPRRSGLFLCSLVASSGDRFKAAAGSADSLTMGKELSTIDPTKKRRSRIGSPPNNNSHSRFADYQEGYYPHQSSQLLMCCEWGEYLILQFKTPFASVNKFVRHRSCYICEYAVGTRKRLLILETVSAYCGSFLSLFQTGCLPKASQCLLCAC